MSTTTAQPRQRLVRAVEKAAIWVCGVESLRIFAGLDTSCCQKELGLFAGAGSDTAVERPAAVWRYCRDSAVADIGRGAGD